MSYNDIKFTHGGRRGDVYTVSTPYGVVYIEESGRKITFQLHEDVRESHHSRALFGYVQQLRKRGIVKYNVAHLDLPGLDRSLDLKRGRAILDLVYEHRGKLYELELKTHREIGIDRTATQLTELSRYCQNLIVLVPRGGMTEMATILHMINLADRVKVDCYDGYEDEEESVATKPT